MEPLSSFAISLAAGIALELIKLNTPKVKKEIEEAFEKALKDWIPNEKIRKHKEYELKTAIQNHINNPLSKLDIPDEFLEKFNLQIAQKPAAYNYLKEVKDEQRFNELKEGIVKTFQKIDKFSDEQAVYNKKISEMHKELLKNTKDSKELISFTYKEQSAPEYPKEFIIRTKSIKNLTEIFKVTDIAFIHGISRCGKTIVTSQYLNTKQIKPYYWYDFKLNQPVKDEALINDFAMYLAKKSGLTISFEDISIQKIIDLLDYYLADHKKITLIIDNCHLAKNYELIDSLFTSILEKGNNRIKLILISESQDTIFKIPTINSKANTTRLTGFDSDEILLLLQLNNIDITNITSELLETLQHTTEGHPDIIIALINAIKKDKNKPQYVIISNLLDGWRKVPVVKKLIENISTTLGNKILTQEDELRIFARLSVLNGKFNQELAEHLSTINPQISNFGIRFKKIKNNLLDFEPNNFYRIPQLFKKAGEEFLGEGEKKDIWRNAAEFIVKPKDGTLTYNDGILACHYFLIANEIERTFHLATNILTQAIETIDKDNLFKGIFTDLDYLLNINVDEQHKNSQALFGLMLLEGYRKTSYNEKVIQTAEKLDEFCKNGFINDEVKYSINIQLLIVNTLITKNIFSITRYIENLVNLNENSNQLEQFQIHFSIDKIFNFVFSFFASNKDDNLEELIQLLECYHKKSYSFSCIFNDTEFVDLLEIILNKIYKSVQLDNDIIDQQLDKIEKLQELFKIQEYTLALRETYYMCGVLISDFKEDIKSSLEHLNIAFEYDSLLPKISENFLAKNNLAIADAYFKLDSWDTAIEYYKKALKNYFLVKDSEVLIYHTLSRIGISNYHLSNFTKAENYLWKAFSFAKQNRIKYKELVITSLGDISIFYYKVRNIKYAIKSLYIIYCLLEESEFTPYHQLLANSVGWYSKDYSTSKLFSAVSQVNKYKNSIEPYWGMFSKKAKFVNPDATMSTLLLLFVEIFLQIKCTEKVLKITKKIITNNSPKSIDIMARFLVCNSLVEVLLDENKLHELKDLTKNFIAIIGLVVEIDDKRFETELKYYSFISQDILIKFRPYFIAKCKDKNDFILKSKFIIWLLGSKDLVKKEFQEEFICETNFLAAHFYANNISFDSVNKNVAVSWIKESNKLALKTGQLEIYFNNQNLYHFFLMTSINNINIFFNDLFETYVLLVDNFDIYYKFAETFSNKFLQLISSIDCETIPTNKERELIDSITAIINRQKPNCLDALDNALLLANIFVKIRNECNFEAPKLDSTINFIIKNLNKYNTYPINEFLSAYHAIKKKFLFKIISEEKKYNQVKKTIKTDVSLLKNDLQDILTETDLEIINHIEKDLLF